MARSRTAPGFRRGLPDVFADEIVVHGVDEVTLFQVTEPVQQIGHLQRHGRLPGARVAGKAHVQVWPGRHQAEPAAGSRLTSRTEAISSTFFFTGISPTS